MWRKSLTVTTQERCEQYWTSLGENTPQSSDCTATYHPSRKLSKLDKPDMRDTTGKVGTNSLVMYSCRPLHTDKQRLEPTHSTSVSVRDVSLKTYRKRWTIEECGERGSGVSAMVARRNDEDLRMFSFIQLFIYLYIYFCQSWVSTEISIFHRFVSNYKNWCIDLYKEIQAF